MARIKQLGMQVASEGRQRAEERRGRTEAERKLRAEKQVRQRYSHSYSSDCTYKAGGLGF